MFGCGFITTVRKNLNDFMCGRLYKFFRFTRNDTVSGLITTASDNTSSKYFTSIFLPVFLNECR